MAIRTLGDLTIKDEDYIFAGDLVVSGNLTIENASLIVSGIIYFDLSEHYIHITNGDISANGINGAGAMDVTIEVGDIYCHDELYVGDINISGGDITTSFLTSSNITSDGDIIANSSSVLSVSCCNYLITGNNSSTDITAIEDIYIFGDNSSCGLTGRDIFLTGNNDLHDWSIIASRALELTGSIQNFASISVGR